jgi:hypothetical protein
MLTEFFMERAQIVLSADAERFIGTVPEFPELRVEAPTPEACERRLRDEVARLLMLEATPTLQPIVKMAVDRKRDCRSCGAVGLAAAFEFCGLCGQRLR